MEKKNVLIAGVVVMIVGYITRMFIDNTLIANVVGYGIMGLGLTICGIGVVLLVANIDLNNFIKFEKGEIEKKEEKFNTVEDYENFEKQMMQQIKLAELKTKLCLEEARQEKIKIQLQKEKEKIMGSGTSKKDMFESMSELIQGDRTPPKERKKDMLDNMKDYF